MRESCSDRMLSLNILGLLIVVYQVKSYSISDDCNCTQLQDEVNVAINNTDAIKACELMNQRKLCLKNKEQFDFRCKDVEEQICDIDNDPLYYACDKIPFRCNKPLGLCLKSDLVNKLHGLPPVENCPTIKRFLKCESTNQLPRTEFKSLVLSADILCKALNDSIYTECDGFLTCYKKLFHYDKDLMKIQSHSWWCNQFKEAMACSGISWNISDISGCLFQDIKKGEVLCLGSSQSSAEAWTTYKVIVCIVTGLFLSLFVLIAVVVVIFKKYRGSQRCFHRYRHNQDMQLVPLDG